MKIRVEITQGQAIAEVYVPDRVSFADVIAEALGLSSIVIQNVVLEEDGTYNVVYSLAEGKMGWLYCRLRINTQLTQELKG